LARTYAEAVRNGTAAASKLLRRLDWQAKLEAEPGAVDIFAIIAELDLPLMLRPLKGLLGAFLKVPTPGILVTTQRPLSAIQAKTLSCWATKTARWSLRCN